MVVKNDIRVNSSSYTLYEGMIKIDGTYGFH